MSDNISLVLLSSFAASTDIMLHIVLGMPSCSQIIGRSSRFPACRLCLLSTVLLARVVPSAPSFQPAIASLSRPSSVLVDTSSGQPPAAALGSSCPIVPKKLTGIIILPYATNATSREISIFPALLLARSRALWRRKRTLWCDSNPAMSQYV